MAALRDDQIIVVILGNTLSSLLSIVGSSMIIYILHRIKKPSVYNRLMFGMSLFDIIQAVSLLIGPFLIPESGGRKWAYGNDQTCLMVGFFVQLGCTVPFYNISLNAFFLLTVVYGMSEARITRWIEPTLHCISILYPLITASIGVGLNLYSELELGVSCWIGEYPRGCDEDPTLECTSTLIGWFYSGIPFVGSFLFLLIANFLIYRKVRKTTKQASQYSIDSVIAHFSIVDSHSSSIEHTVENKPNINRCNIGKLIWRFITCAKTSQIDDHETKNDIIDNTLIRNKPEYSRKMSMRTTEMELRRKERHRLKNSRANAVLIQATLYVLACLSTIFWMMVLRVIESGGFKREDESTIFWLTLLTHLTFPLQGFWNLLIFVRPKYLRWRRQEPAMSKYWAFKQCLFNTHLLANIPTAVPQQTGFSTWLQGVTKASLKLGDKSSKVDKFHSQNSEVEQSPRKRSLHEDERLYPEEDSLSIKCEDFPNIA
jgi:hypothetical protein